MGTASTLDGAQPPTGPERNGEGTKPIQSSINFVTGHWIPVLLDDGSTRLIAPCEIGETWDGRTPIRVRGTLPDGGLVRLEFLIGLFQQVMPPQTSADWLDGYFAPPSAAHLSAIIEASGLVPHFDLFGDTPAFQDRSVGGEPPQGVSALFLLQPGEQTRSRNQDIWGRDITAVGLPEVMEALYGLQIFSPAGGRGARTSPSGGGPLRTYVMDETLWTTVWSNILPKRQWDGLGNGATDARSLVPWIDFRVDAPTPVDAPASHLFWGCPRRILLCAAEDGVCDLSGRAGPVVRSLRMAAYGPDYRSDLWRHPLTPYYRIRKGATVQRLPRLAGAVATGTSWRDYVGLFQEKGAAGDAGVEPALAVGAWRRERATDTGKETVRIHAFGYRCDKAKVLGVVSSAMPFLTVPPAVEAEFSVFVENVVGGSDDIASALKRQTLLALFDANALESVPSDYASRIEADFWARTAATFRDFAQRVRAHLVGGGAPNDPAALDAVAAAHNAIADTARRLFDERVDLGQTDNPERVVTARRKVQMTVYGAPVRRAFGLPVPAGGAGTTRKPKRKGKTP